ncbi:hypothetical protein HO133_000937 [Letharia lupina]|uniref:Uncharacterized protein n=1 Tax=Letharia lupina TaxID=560253 RepID=A0A8H6CGS2_9LECA|nr:uncharacterized protein HO133_000937 [Letharia lupina]KAF6222886.1 hypothetical protein HO133_000937 [Letharia lupina]
MADKSVDETVHVPAVDTTVARSDRWEGNEERCCHVRQSGRQSLYFEDYRDHGEKPQNKDDRGGGVGRE